MRKGQLAEVPQGMGYIHRPCKTVVSTVAANLGASLKSCFLLLSERIHVLCAESVSPNAFGCCDIQLQTCFSFMRLDHPSPSL